jgi:hypothetical protein
MNCLKDPVAICPGWVECILFYEFQFDWLHRPSLFKHIPPDESGLSIADVPLPFQDSRLGCNRYKNPIRLYSMI